MSRVAIVFYCLFLFPLGFALAEPNNKHNIGQGVPQKSGQADPGSDDMRIPPGLDISETDLQCKKSHILDSLRGSAQKAERAQKALDQIGTGGSDEDAKKLRTVCLDAYAAASESEEPMHNLQDKKQDDARAIKRGSPLYKLAMRSGQAKPIQGLCQKLMGVIPEGYQFEGMVTELKAALDSLVADSKQRFNQAKGDNSHK